MRSKRLIFTCSLVVVALLIGLILSASCAPEPAPAPAPTPAPAPAPAPAPPPAPEVIEWKLQSVWPRGDLSVEALPYFAERVEERSNGRLKIDVFAEPEIVPLPEVLPATTKGTLDVAHGGAVWAMFLPIADVEFGALNRFWYFPEDDVESGAMKVREIFYDYKGGRVVELLQQEYGKHNLHWLDMHTYGPSCLLSTKEVHTLNDIKGLKVADVGGWMNVWDEKLGYSPAPDFPGSEVYMALKLGTLDAVRWDLSAVTGLSWYEVAPYWVSNDGQTSQAIGNMLVNLDSWNALPDDLKAALAGAAEDYFHKTIEVYGGELDKVKDLVAKGEITESLMDEEFQRVANEAAWEIWDMAAEADEASAEFIQIVKEWKGME